MLVMLVKAMFMAKSLTRVTVFPVAGDPGHHIHVRADFRDVDLTMIRHAFGVRGTAFIVTAGW
jgi:hypothetical protein